MIRNALTAVTLAVTALLLVATSRPVQERPRQCEQYPLTTLTHTGTCGWQNVTLTEVLDCTAGVTGLATVDAVVTTDGGITTIAFSESLDAGQRDCNASRNADAGFDVACTCFFPQADGGCSIACSGTLHP